MIKHEKSKAEVKGYKEKEARNLGFGHGPEGLNLYKARFEIGNSSVETLKNNH